MPLALIISSHVAGSQVVFLHLEKVGAKLSTLRPDQAAYINVPENGPFKPDHYRY